jgi:hypothetical protein
MQPSGSVSAACSRHGIHGRYGDELGEPAGQSRDAVLTILDALVRVARRTVLADRCAGGAVAVQTLVDDHQRTGPDSPHVGARLVHHPHDLVAENLRRPRQRDRHAAVVGVVVRMAAEDMEVGAAEPDGRHAHEHLGRSGRADRHLTDFDVPDVGKDSGSHGRVLGPTSYVRVEGRPKTCATGP